MVQIVCPSFNDLPGGSKLAESNGKHSRCKRRRPQRGCRSNACFHSSDSKNQRRQPVPSWNGMLFRKVMGL